MKSLKESGLKRKKLGASCKQLALGNFVMIIQLEEIFSSTTKSNETYIAVIDLYFHQEIISRPNPLSGSEFYLIHLDLFRSALNPPLSTLTSSGLSPKLFFRSRSTSSAAADSDPCPS